MATPQEIVLKKISLHKPLTRRKLEAYMRVSQIADVIVKKYPFLTPKAGH